MNALPLVSVVVPNYNYKRYLNLRIQSILQQTYQNIELILLDDASTDGSEEVLSDYQDHAKVSHILLNEHNTGNPFKQWFKGMQLAKGKYINAHAAVQPGGPNLRPGRLDVRLHD